jgi:mannose-6-phosphate isomerase-like protein (cupin superfamily)
MKYAYLRFGRGFKVSIENVRSQAAQMVLDAEAKEGGKDNRHRGSDQWLFVVSGNGLAVVNGRRHRLRPGSLILIERGDTHEIRNPTNKPLETLNIYVPPAYERDGSEKSAGRG